MPSWRTWSFLANQCFLGKNHGTTKTCIFIRRNFFSKYSSSQLNYSFHNLVENVCHHPDFLHSKTAYRVKIIFFEKSFVSKCFLDTWNAILTNMLKECRHETVTFPSLPKGKKLCLWQSFLLELFLCTRRMPSLFVQSLYEVLVWTRRFQFDTTSECFCQEFGTVPLNVGKRFKIVIFMKKKSFYSTSFSDHMDCSFGNSVKFVLAVAPETLAQTPKIRKNLFLLEKCPSEIPAGHLECLPDEPGFFLQINVSFEKPWKYIKFVFIWRKILSKCSSSHLVFVCITPVEKVCQRPEFIHSKSAYRVKNIFFRKKKFFSKCFSGHMERCFDKSAKSVSPGICNFSFFAQRAKNFGLWQKFLLEMFLCTRRVPS